MDDNNNTPNPGFGMNRRDLLKRGAVVGGALMWAAPTVQTIGMRAAFAQDGGTPQDADLISCVLIRIQCGDDCFYVKWQDDSDGAGGGSWEASPGDHCGQSCTINLTGCTAADGADYFNDPTVCSPGSGNTDCLEFCLSDTSCTITGYAVFGATNCETNDSVSSTDCVTVEL